MLKGKNVIFFGRSWRFSLSDFIHFPLKVRWTFWKYCNKTQRKAFFLNRWCVKFRNMRSLMVVKCYVPFLPHPLHLALPTSLGQTRCPSIPQDLPIGNPFPLLLQTLTLPGKPNSEEIWAWLLRKRHAQGIQNSIWCLAHAKDIQFWSHSCLTSHQVTKAMPPTY